MFNSRQSHACLFVRVVDNRKEVLSAHAHPAVSIDNEKAIVYRALLTKIKSSNVLQLCYLFSYVHTFEPWLPGLHYVFWQFMVNTGIQGGM